MEEPWDMWHEAYDPLDFSKVHGFPNECYDPEIHDIHPEFHGNDGLSATHHISSFCKLMGDFNVRHEDEIMIIFAITLVNDAMTWFYGLLDKSIDLVPNFFERFLLHWHDGTVDEIEQLAKEYDALIPRLHPELKEQTIEDPIGEALQETLVEDIAEEIPDMAIIEDIEDVKLPQVYEQLPDEKLELPQVHHIEGNTIFYADQLEQFDNKGLYVSPINQWIEASCAQFDSSYYNLLFSNDLMFQFSFTHELIARHSCFMASISLSLSLTKHRKKQIDMEEMLKWLHWLYPYT